MVTSYVIVIILSTEILTTPAQMRNSLRMQKATMKIWIQSSFLFMKTLRRSSDPKSGVAATSSQNQDIPLQEICYHVTC